MSSGRLIIPAFDPALYNGEPVAGATLTVYANRTTTLAAVWQNRSLSVAAKNAAPGDVAAGQVSNAQGRWQEQSPFLWLNAAALYTVVVQYPATAGGGTFTMNDVAVLASDADGSSVDSVAALRAISGLADGEAVNLLGYYARGDGGGGDLWVDGTDITSADNGGTVFVTADGKRVKRPKGPVHAAWFGLNYNNTADNAEKINAALLVAESWKVNCILPAGWLRCESTINVPVPVSLIGSGANVLEGFKPPFSMFRNGTVIYKAHNGVGVSCISPGTGIYGNGAPAGTIRNITVSSDYDLWPSTSGHAFVWDKVASARGEYLVAQSCGGGGFRVGVTTGDVSIHNYLQDCYANNCGPFSFAIRSKWFRGNRLVSDGSQISLILENSPESLITEFHFEGFFAGAVAVNNTSGQTELRSGYIGHTNASDLTLLASTGSSNGDILLNAVDFRAGTGGAYRPGTKGAVLQSGTFGFRFRDCTFHGLGTPVDFASAVGTTQHIMDGCSLFHCGAIRLATSNVRITNNSFDTTQGDWTIDHVSGTVGEISGNTVDKPLKATASGTAGNFSGIIVRNNIGYVTKNRGNTASIASNTAVSHGLVGPPNGQVVVTMQTGGTGMVHIGAESATSFTPVWANGGNAQFHWIAACPCDPI